MEGKHLSSPFPRLNFNSPLQTPSFPPCYCHKLCSVCLCCCFLLTLFLCSGVGSPQASSFKNIYLLQRRVFHSLQWISALPWSTSSFLLSPWCYLCCLSPFPPTSSSWQFLPFLDYAFMEMPLAWLMCSGVSCSGFGASRIWHSAAPGFVPQRPPCSYHLTIYPQKMVLYIYMIWYDQMAAQPPFLLLSVAFKQATFTSVDIPHLQQVIFAEICLLC